MVIPHFFDSADTMSWSFWVRGYNTTFHWIANKRSGGCRMFSFWQNSIVYDFTVGNCTDLETVAGNMGTDGFYSWIHVVGTWNDATKNLTIYLNSTQKQSKILDNNFDIYSASPHDFEFGSSTLADYDLDQFIIFNKTLTQQDVNDIFALNREDYNLSVGQVLFLTEFNNTVAPFDDEKGISPAVSGIATFIGEQWLDVFRFNSKIQADDYLYNSPHYFGDAIADIRNIKPLDPQLSNEKWGEVDHTTYPEGFVINVSKTQQKLSLIGGVQFLTKAVQDIVFKLDDIETKQIELESRIEALEKTGVVK